MFKQIKTEICTSKAKINFPEIHDKYNLESERIAVPEVDGFW